jgi:very-short-patch-repair endonuclease
MQMEMINNFVNSKKYLTLETLQTSNYWSALQPFYTNDIQNPRQLVYHFNIKSTDIPNCPCGNKVSWHTDKRQYRSYCSKKCTGMYTSAIAKTTNQQKYGVNHFSQTAEFVEKCKTTSLAKFGVDHYSKTQEHQERVQQTNLKNLGVTHAASSPAIKKKTKEYFVQKFGVENPMQCSEIKQKLITTNNLLYGVDNPAQKHYTFDTLELLNNLDLFKELCQTTPIYTIAQQYNISVTPLYSLAKKHNIELPKFKHSQLENEVFDYITSIYTGKIERNNRTLLKNLEVDIVLEELKLAIECNGTYWHSELNNRHKQYHQNKTKLLKDLGYNLVHIWEHNWYQKQDIVKSMIASRFKLSAKVHARQCQVNQISSKDAQEFLNCNHIQGSKQLTSINFGLFNNNMLVAVMTFCKNRFSKNHDWELLRFANKLHYNVVGGASKLFSAFVKQYQAKSVLSYCDLSHSTGNMYQKLGFTFLHNSNPNYFYTNDYYTMHSRNKFQKHKLPKLLTNFDATLSEWDNMKANGYDRIWDCGNAVYSWHYLR